MNLKTATVTGFSIRTTQHGQPSGTCDHCGTGIKYCVHIVDGDGKAGIIGTTCAERIGGVVGECARYHMTEDQRAARAARIQCFTDKREGERMRYLLDMQARLDGPIGDFCAELMASGDDFHASLGRQLAERPLSPRQAHFAMLYLLGIRRVTKKNEAEAVALFDAISEK